MTKDIQAWEDEGGAAPALPGVSAAPISGTAAQVQRPERGKRQVSGRVRPCGEVIPIDRWKSILEGKLEADSIMNIRPLYDRIVVKRIEEQETTRNGIVIPDSAKEKPQQGEVMAVGRGKRLENGELVALDLKVGDRILFGKYTGSETKLNGAEYIVMREDDVLGVLEAAAGAARKAI
jgi:chaperonin GroES